MAEKNTLERDRFKTIFGVELPADGTDMAADSRGIIRAIVLNILCGFARDTLNAKATNNTVLCKYKPSGPPPSLDDAKKDLARLPTLIQMCNRSSDAFHEAYKLADSFGFALPKSAKEIVAIFDEPLSLSNEKPAAELAPVHS